MQLLQGLNFLCIMVDTFHHCGEVNIELLNSTYLRITSERHSRFFKFKKNVTWPGLVKINMYGEIDLLLYKNESAIWNGTYPIETTYEGLDPVKIPDYYDTRVIKKDDLGPMAGILYLRYEKPLYSQINPGNFLRVKQTLDGAERSLLYVPVPYLPIHNLSYPNPKPDEWAYTDRPVNLMVFKRKSRLNTWLLDRQIGDKVIVGNPQGTFKIKMLKNSHRVFLAAEGFGVAPLVSIALWVLQVTTHANVHFGIFNEFQEDNFWIEELKSICKADKRFHLSFYNVRRPTPKKNHLFETIPPPDQWVLYMKGMEKIFPPVSEPSHIYFCVSGSWYLGDLMWRYINASYGADFKRIYIFHEIVEMTRTPENHKYTMENPEHLEHVRETLFKTTKYIPPHYEDTYYSKEMNRTD